MSFTTLPKWKRAEQIRQLKDGDYVILLKVKRESNPLDFICKRELF